MISNDLEYLCCVLNVLLQIHLGIINSLLFLCCVYSSLPRNFQIRFQIYFNSLRCCTVLNVITEGKHKYTNLKFVYL